MSDVDVAGASGDTLHKLKKAKIFSSLFENEAWAPRTSNAVNVFATFRTYSGPGKHLLRNKGLKHIRETKTKVESALNEATKLTAVKAPNRLQIEKKFALVYVGGLFTHACNSASFYFEVR